MHIDIAQTLTLAQKIAQMVMVGFRGLALDPANPVVADVRERGVGSVVLFSRDMVLDSPMRNVASPAQLQALDAALHALAASSSAGIPLMIAIDQEGGRVARLDEQRGFPPTQSAQVLGERGDPDYTYARAAEMARTLAAAGINHNLAPAVDLNLNPESPAIGKLGRSFSADPAVVIDHARAFIAAHRAHKITTTIKHFPGHGSARADSHKGFVDVTESWQEVELEPYRALIAEGAVDAVMSAHVFNARLDPVYPATLSPAILTGLLREQLGFTGVIMTDDMGMKAITTQYGFAEAVVQTVLAGADMLTFGNNLAYDPDVASRVIAILTQAVADGIISEQRIAASCARILALKAQWR
ncbi:MAG: glycoside hydrolase family 3 [Caldilineaceae bacterium]|nr:glycoside hydrolase family 3 [Caldilineaceae bacterium]